MLVTRLSTSNKEDVVFFSNLAKSAFPEFVKDCKPNSVNCLRFFHLNSTRDELEKYIEEKPFGIIFNECSPARIESVMEKVSKLKSTGYSPVLIGIEEISHKYGFMRKAKNIEEARLMVLNDPVFV